MDTRDGTKNEDDESAFTFKLAGDNPRAQAVRVSLGSLEFPMVQWTIEESWCRLYFSEGFRITNETSYFQMYERVDSEEGNEHTVQLPSHLNPIEKIETMTGGTVVTCRDPHGLWVNEGTGCVIPVIEWGDVEVICSVLGRISLTSLHNLGYLKYISAHSFRIPEIECDSVQAGYLHVPTYPSPSHLCETLCFVLNHLTTRARYEIAYNVTQNLATIQALDYPLESKRLHVRIYGSKLLNILGYNSPTHERIFFRPKTTPDRHSTEENFHMHMLDDTTQPPLCLTSDMFRGWHHVELPCGWYAPTHRPMCTGAPLRIQQEVEFSLNRLNFQRPDKIPIGTPSGWVMLFSDPSGTHHICHIYHGQYTAEAIAACLETEMTRLAARVLPGTLYTVEYQNSRFSFACEVRDHTGIVRPAPFSVFLPHPNSIDPRRFGFAGTMYGRDTYTSPNSVIVPSMQSQLLRPPTNLYHVSEIGHQKRLCIAPQPPPPLVALITAYNVNTHTVSARVYSSQFPYAHGLIPGDVVHITSLPSPQISILKMNDRGVWEEEAVRKCPLAPRWGRSGVVVDNAGISSGFPMPNSEQVDISIKVRPTVDLVSCIDMVVSLRIDVEPFNLCFGTLPNSVPAKLLGFPEGSTQWGLDGSIPSGRLFIPPFIAPAVHCLDHPDYVLMYLSEGKYGTTLQHKHGSNTTSPFAKLVLYPLFREERMLPRDTLLLSGESLAQFTIRFTNPDGTPYHFHGTSFSFSLNFLRQAQNSEK